MHEFDLEKQEDIATKKPQEVAQQTTKRLEGVFEAYQSLWDSCTITGNVIGDIRRREGEDVALLANAKTFRLETLEKQEEVLLQARKYLDEMAVLKLWGVFEEGLRWFLKGLLREIEANFPFQIPKELSYFFHNFSSHAGTVLETWKIEDQLNFLKKIVPSSLLGHIKNIYKYRNELAHGKELAQRKYKVIHEPRFAYDSMRAFFEGDWVFMASSVGMEVRVESVEVEEENTEE